MDNYRLISRLFVKSFKLNLMKKTFKCQSYHAEENDRLVVEPMTQQNKNFVLITSYEMGEIATTIISKNQAKQLIAHLTKEFGL